MWKGDFPSASMALFFWPGMLCSASGRAGFTDVGAKEFNAAHSLLGGPLMCVRGIGLHLQGPHCDTTTTLSVCMLGLNPAVTPDATQMGERERYL